MSQKEVGDLVGVSNTAVSFYEANYYEPFDLTRQRVINFIGFDPYATTLPETTIQQLSPLV